METLLLITLVAGCGLVNVVAFWACAYFTAIGYRR